jgi:POT family proton-dependent oligopeptide transporter
MLLLAVGLAVTVFRGAYEQVGNTVALWIEGVNRHVGSREIPMTWFQSLNPLLVIVLTPLLLARWKRKAAGGREHSPLQKMATGAVIVASSYALLAAAAALTPVGASWLWVAGFFFLLTLGELYILPTGLGLFARLAPPKLGATTVAAWYLAIFTGSMTAGLIGSWYSSLAPSFFFLTLTGVASLAALMLVLLDRRARSVEAARIAERSALAAVPEGLATNV